ncbi:hypothetical protein C5167_015111 [Papaver somniferum]|uniref:BRCT domain-containing protein n=1 Tax=Papaver somniferum TaxID=3469 RepID=A0A4Y7J8Z1_PAPSO|nr:BRCT domain-containing protein At4g02110-like isoform X1 [Papaver somniferum]RZC56248.1 hypothetical protein C5167_015111 [Papaver somniferum]
MGEDYGGAGGSDSKIFDGVRFILLGFNPSEEAKVQSKLINGGGVNVGEYGSICTHVIVDKIVYDDQRCVIARKDGKTVVNSVWVDHSFDVGMPVDSSLILYRPVKDLSGIVGAKSFIVCLTGYQRQDREDIMRMVSMMGANFSKPLVANKVTHLICYKFEGEKYDLAKKMQRIKLVNHRWLEDCLKAWEILPECDYNKSGHEIEIMEAEAKDSEDETEEYRDTAQLGVENVTDSSFKLHTGSGISTSKGSDLATPVRERSINKQTSAAKGLLDTSENITSKISKKESRVGDVAESSSKLPGGSDGLNLVGSGLTTPVRKTSSVHLHGSTAKGLIDTSENVDSESRLSINAGKSIVAEKTTNPLVANQQDFGSLSSGAYRNDDTGSRGNKTPSSKTGKRPFSSDATNTVTISHTKKMHKTSPVPYFSGEHSSHLRSSPLGGSETNNDGFGMSPLKSDQVKNKLDFGEVEDQSNESELHHSKLKDGTLTPKKKKGLSCSSPKSSNTGKDGFGISPLKADQVKDNLDIGHIENQKNGSELHHSKLEGRAVTPMKKKSLSSPSHESLKKGSPDSRTFGATGTVASTTLEREIVRPEMESSSTPSDRSYQMDADINTTKNQSVTLKRKLGLSGTSSGSTKKRSPYSITSGTGSTVAGATPEGDISIALETRPSPALANSSHAAEAIANSSANEPVKLAKNKSSSVKKKSKKCGLPVSTNMISDDLKSPLQQNVSVPSAAKTPETSLKELGQADLVSSPDFGDFRASRSAGLDTKASSPDSRTPETQADKSVGSVNIGLNKGKKNGPSSRSGTKTKSLGTRLLSAASAKERKGTLNLDQATTTREGSLISEEGTNKAVQEKLSNVQTETIGLPRDVDKVVDQNSNHFPSSVNMGDALDDETEAPEDENAVKSFSQEVAQLSCKADVGIKENSEKIQQSGSKVNSHRSLMDGEKMISGVDREDVKKNKEDQAKKVTGGVHSSNRANKATVSSSKDVVNDEKLEMEKTNEVSNPKSRVQRRTVSVKTAEEAISVEENKTIETEGPTVRSATYVRKKVVSKSLKKPKQANKMVTEASQEEIPVSEVKPPSSEDQRNGVSAVKEVVVPREIKDSVDNENNKTRAEMVATKRRASLASKTKKSKKEKPINDLNETKSAKRSTVNAGEHENETVVEAKRRVIHASNTKESNTEIPLDGEKETKTAKNRPNVKSGEHENVVPKPDIKCKQSNKKAESSTYSNIIQAGRVSKPLNSQPMLFILSGHRLQRKEFQQVIKRLKGRCCRDSHNWSYQATHFIVPDPVRRTEKFFAAAASGRWILKTDYLTACNQAGKFVEEEPYEWSKTGLNEEGTISFEAPRKWRQLKERTGHGAFHGMRIVVYGECIAPPLDTLKRVVKAGDGTILATSPPYTKFLKSGIDFAVITQGMPKADLWVQEFIRNEIPCVVADYLVEYVCRPDYALDKHVLYNTNVWADKSLANLEMRSKEIAEPSSPSAVNDEPSDSGDVPCQVCGSRDREEVMLICGDESGSIGCGIGTHIDCCNPPLKSIPVEDWFCPNCSITLNCKKDPPKTSKKKVSSSMRGKK